MQGRKPVAPPTVEDDVVPLPSSAVRIPEPPAHLQGRQIDCWKEMAGIMVSRNLYDEDCATMLMAFCVQYARWLDADEQVQQTGMLLKNKKGGAMHSPYIALANAAHDRMVRMASEMGLTPVSRRRAVRVRGVSAQIPAMKYLQKKTTG